VRKFFIVGCPRSGTTVLQQALNRHTEIVIPPETKYFYCWYGKSAKQQSAHLQRINADLRVNVVASRRGVRAPDEGAAFFERLADAYLERLGRQDAVCFGEKTPEHTGQLGQIRSVFPNAKLLFIYRDGRDVALSLSKMPWMHCDLYTGFVIWLYYYRILKRERQRPSLDTCFARYEDLATHPARELGRVLEFLGVPFEPAVAEGWGNQEGVPRRELAWKGRAIEKISTARIGVWRRELSKPQIGRLERLGRKALRDLGYPLCGPRTRPLPPWFVAALGWRVLRTVTRLPPYCVRNEIVGSVSRLLASTNLDTPSWTRRTPVGVG